MEFFLVGLNAVLAVALLLLLGAAWYVYAIVALVALILLVAFCIGKIDLWSP